VEKRDVVRIGAVVAMAVLTGVAGPATAKSDEPLQAIPFTDVTVTGSFWKARLETNRKVTIPYDFKKCDELGLIDNFARAAGFMPADTFQPNGNNGPSRECDVYKTIEGASYVLAEHPDVMLDLYLDTLIDRIAAAQEPDGYLYPVRRFLPPEKMGRGGKERWERLANSQELYAVGHLYEAAVAHYQATGKRTLLNVATRNADLLCKVFGPGRREYPPGHQEIEIGLVRLYRVTGEEKYLNLAGFFVDIRGRPETHPLYGANFQDHVPVAEQEEAVGHAVRAAYLYSGMADIAMATDRREYIKVLDRVWQDVVSTKLYITGGVGAQRKGEAYGEAYSLGNKTAYCETCAALAHAMWSQRMFLIHGDAKYVDVVERIIYNGFLSGVSLSGDRFFYVNPLASDGNYTRSPWFGTPCCPTNIVRFLPSLAGYAYARGGDRLYVNLFGGSTVHTTIDGNAVRVVQEAEYPWDGDIRIGIEVGQAQEFVVCVRIPGWARNRPVPGDLYSFAEKGPGEAELEVNGRRVRQPEMEKGFAVIRRTWQTGDTIRLRLPMPVRRVRSHEEVVENRGKVALQRGPVVYCVEAVDNDGQVRNLVLPDDAALEAKHADLLGGVTIITGPAKVLSKETDGTATEGRHTLTAVPYHLWAHRAGGEMAVWLPTCPND